MKFLVFLLTICLISAPSWAGCEALKEEQSYSGKYRSYKFLIEGKEGWIFRSKQDLREKFSLDEQAWGLLSDLQQVFKARNIDLVIAFAPTRGMVAPDMIPQGLYDVAKARQSYREFLDEAAKRGLNIAGSPDIRNGRDYFYKADHHWTSVGAREMAGDVARMVKTLPVYNDIDKTTYKTTVIGKRTLKSVFAAPVDALCGSKIDDLTDVVYSTTLQTEDFSEDALFSDLPVPQIALVGTSNSRRSRLDMNFEGFLKEFLGADVHNAALAGAGMEDPMMAYLESDHFKRGKTRIIIWEIPGYYNLDSDRSKDAMRQILATLKGNCKNPVMESKSVPVMQENTVVFSAKDISLKDSYFVFSFNKPVNIQGFMTIAIGDHAYETFKFKRSPKYPESRFYFYKPEYEGIEPMREVLMKFPKARGGLTFDAKVCRYE